MLKKFTQSTLQMRGLTWSVEARTINYVHHKKIHVHQYTCTEWTWNSTHKYGLPRVQRLRAIHHEIAIIEIPRANLDLLQKPARNKTNQKKSSF